MDQAQAERALQIIRQVIQNTRDDLIDHNWGLVWMVHAFANLIAFSSIGYLVEARGLPMPYYIVPLGAVAVLNLLILRLLTDRDRGVRSYVERQLFGIWMSYIAFSLAGAAFLHFSGAPTPLYGSLIALTTGVGFAMMGVVFYRMFFTVAAAFLIVTVASPLIPTIQWTVIGIVWWLGLFFPGLSMHKERARRKHEPVARIL